MTDLSEINNIRYGILNADEWEKSLAIIITKKVEEFELTAENQGQLQAQVENVLYRLLDEVEVILKNDMGKVKRLLVNTFVDLEKLRESVPELSAAILEELSKPENKDNISEYILQKLDSFVAEIYNLDEQLQLKQLLDKYECEDRDAASALLVQLSNRTHNRLSVDVLFLIILLVGTFLINISKAVGKDRSRYFILLIVVFIFLVLGISTPMINIEAKISRLTFFLLGENIIFENQVLFFQSKSIMDVVWVLISTWKIDMIIVGIMIFTFSVLFPFTKIFCSFLTLQNPTKYRNIKWISFFTFKSGKWSMADVFVIAIFMAFIGFNGIVSNQLKNMSKVYENVEILTTNGTSLQMGFYLFLMFCITGLFLSDSIKKHIP